MADGVIDVLSDKRALARKRAYETPLETLNPAWASAFRDDAHWPYFERLRAEDPVHWTPDSNYGAFWSITKYNDIMAIDTNHQVFSSAKGSAVAQAEPGLPAGRLHRARNQRRRQQLHHHGSARPRHPAQDGEPGGRARPTGRDGPGDPRAGRHRSSTACRSASRSTGSIWSPKS